MNDDDKLLLDSAYKALDISNLEELAVMIGYAKTSVNNWYGNGLSDKARYKIKELIEQRKNKNKKFLDVTEVFNIWMQEQKFKSEDELATFLNLNKRTFDKWKEQKYIPFDEIKKYKLFKADKYLKNKNNTDDSKIYFFKELEIYGSYIENMESEGAQFIAEYLLDKYQINYYEIEKSEFIYHDYDTDKNDNHIKGPRGIKITISSEKEILNDKKIEESSILKLDNHIAEKELEILEAFRCLPKERQEGIYHKVKYEAVEYGEKNTLKAM